VILRGEYQESQRWLNNKLPHVLMRLQLRILNGH